MELVRWARMDGATNTHASGERQVTRAARLAGVVLVLAIPLWWAACVGPGVADERPRTGNHREIDTSTLRHKVLCGYQGWFRCPGDPARAGWRHWSREA